MTLPEPDRYRNGASAHHRRHRTASTEAEKPRKTGPPLQWEKKAHTDKNVVIVDLRRKCIGFLSRTYVGETHDKKIADSEGISYPLHFPRKPIGEQAPADEISPPHLRGRKLSQPGSVR